MECYCCGGKVAWLSDEESEDEENKFLSYLACMNCNAKITVERIIDNNDRN